MYNTYLYHHGILGQHWGKKNGPPYPLDAGDHSASEKKAGWRKSLSKSGVDKDEKNGYNKDTGEKKKFTLTSNQKKAIAIGAAAVATGLVMYGAYKTGALDKFIGSGKDALHGGLESIGKASVSDITNETSKSVSASIKKLNKPESLAESLKNANPLKRSEEGKNNCTYCSVAGFLRRAGYNVTAKGTGGVGQNPAGVWEKCFKDVQVLEGTAGKFGRSKRDAEEFLLKRFGDNAEGVVSVPFNSNGDGHAFNWKIENGKVFFMDFQQGTSGSQLDMYWNFIDPNGYFAVARLDGLKINFVGLKDIVE